MKSIYRNIDKAVLEAVANLYLKERRITLSNSQINGEKVPWHVFNAICERIKYNANLHNGPKNTNLKSQIILNIAGKKKVFKVLINKKGNIELSIASLPFRATSGRGS